MKEKTLEQTRKELKTLSIMSHFAGELSVIGSMLTTGVIYTGANLANHPIDTATLSQIAGWTITAYTSTQALAFHLAGISRTPEQNRINALENRTEEQIAKSEGRYISASIERKFAELQEHYANNYEKYLPQLNFYAKIRRFK